MAWLHPSGQTRQCGGSTLSGMPSLLKCKVLALARPCCRRAHYYNDSESSHTCMPTCVRRRQPPCPPQQLPLPQQRAQARLPWAATRQSAATPPLPRGGRPARSKMGEAKEEKVDFYSLPSVPPIVTSTHEDLLKHELLERRLVEGLHGEGSDDSAGEADKQERTQ